VVDSLPKDLQELLRSCLVLLEDAAKMYTKQCSYSKHTLSLVWLSFDWVWFGFLFAVRYCLFSSHLAANFESKLNFAGGCSNVRMVAYH